MNALKTIETEDATILVNADVVIVIGGGSLNRALILAAVTGALNASPVRGQEVTTDYIVTSDGDNESFTKLTYAIEHFVKIAPESEEVTLHVRAYSGDGAADYQEGALVWEGLAVRICARDKL